MARIHGFGRVAVEAARERRVDVGACHGGSCCNVDASAHGLMLQMLEGSDGRR